MLQIRSPHATAKTWHSVKLMLVPNRLSFCGLWPLIQCMDPLICEYLQNGHSESVIPSFFFNQDTSPLKETYCDLPFGYPRTELIQERQEKMCFLLILFLSIFKITRFCFCNTLSRNQFIFVEGAYCLISVLDFVLFC